MRFNAKLLSVLFHPLLIPSYLFLICFWALPALQLGASGSNYIESYFELSMIKIFVLTFFFPLLTILMMIKLGFVQSIQMPDQKERLFPYVAVSIYFMWAFMVFHKANEPFILVLVLLASVVSVLVSMVVNALFIKLSMHAVAMGVAIGLVRTLMELSNFNLLFLFIFTLLIAGLVGTSRLLLKSHSENEVYVGYLMGLFSFFIAIRIDQLIN